MQNHFKFIEENIQIRFESINSDLDIIAENLKEKVKQIEKNLLKKISKKKLSENIKNTLKSSGLFTSIGCSKNSKQPNLIIENNHLVNINFECRSLRNDNNLIKPIVMDEAKINELQRKRAILEGIKDVFFIKRVGFFNY